MANQTGAKVSASGLSVLDALAKSKLANPDDLVMLQALNANAVVDELEQAYAQSVHELAFTADDKEDDSEEGSHDEGNNT